MTKKMMSFKFTRETKHKLTLWPRTLKIHQILRLLHLLQAMSPDLGSEVSLVSCQVEKFLSNHLNDEYLLCQNAISDDWLDFEILDLILFHCNLQEQMLDEFELNGPHDSIVAILKCFNLMLWTCFLIGLASGQPIRTDNIPRSIWRWCIWQSESGSVELLTEVLDIRLKKIKHNYWPPINANLPGLYPGGNLSVPKDRSGPNDPPPPLSGPNDRPLLSCPCCPRPEPALGILCSNVLSTRFDELLCDWSLLNKKVVSH